MNGEVPTPALAVVRVVTDLMTRLRRPDGDDRLLLPELLHGDDVVLIAKMLRADLIASLIIVGVSLTLQGCWGSGSGTAKVYSGGGPLPEESEVIERLKKMPQTGRYDPEKMNPKPTSKRTSRPRR